MRRISLLWKNVSIMCHTSVAKKIPMEEAKRVPVLFYLHQEPDCTKGNSKTKQTMVQKKDNRRLESSHASRTIRAGPYLILHSPNMRKRGGQQTAV